MVSLVTTVAFDSLVTVKHADDPILSNKSISADPFLNQRGIELKTVL